MVNDNAVILFGKPGRARRYMKRISVTSNLPIGGNRATAHVMSRERADLIARNLRARGFEATAEPAMSAAQLDTHRRLARLQNDDYAFMRGFNNRHED